MPKLSENFNNQYSGNLKCDPSCTHTHTHTHECRGAHTNNKTRKKNILKYMNDTTKPKHCIIYLYIHMYQKDACSHARDM